MMIVALILRAWIVQMKTMAVTPRVLADDLQLISTGTRHLENFEFAFTKTHKHLADMGAKLAAQKSLTFSSEASAREWLKEHKWRRAACKNPVVTNCRDLGAHLNTLKGRRVGTTLTTRMQKTAKIVFRLGRTKAPYVAKTEVIRTKLNPKALYGCEHAPVNETALRVLRTNVAHASTYVASRRSLD